MPFMYSRTGEQVELIPSPEDVAVRFDMPDVARRAIRSARTGLTALHESTPRGFGRVVLLHGVAAGEPTAAAIRAALPATTARASHRPLPVYREPSTGLRVVATREITVRFRPQAAEQRKEELLGALGLTILRGNPFHLRQYIVAQPEHADGTRTLELANRLNEAKDLVEYAAPNLISEHRKVAATNDPRLSEQWHLNNAGRNGAVLGEDVGAYAAWGIVPGGSPEVVIAIIDDGVDIGHPDLKANIWQNQDANAGDRNGRNFYDEDFDPSPRYFRPPYNELEGNDIHGTPCAGVAAAVGDNRRGVAGIAYRCRILPVKIFGADDLAPNDRVANAIRYAGLHAAVLSCSWSGPVNPDLEAAISDVVASGRAGKGCLVFCATGNDSRNSIGFPARHRDALAVGASNDQGKRSQYSNFGNGIDFVAPSNDFGRTGITTTDVSRRNRGFSLNSAYTDRFGGTSSATPLAAGIGALVLSHKPTLTWDAARDLLRQTADKIDPAGGSYNAQGFSLQYGYGRLNAHKAVL